MLAEVKYNHILNHSLFSTLNSDQISDLSRQTKVKIAHKGDIINFSNPNEKKIFFIIKGKVKIAELNSDGDEIIKEVVMENDLFGQIGDTNENPPYEFAQILSHDAIICEFRIEDFEQIMEKNPILSINYANKLWSKLKRSEMRYSRLAHKNVKSRLIDFIKEWADVDGKVADSGISIKNYLTHSDVAGLINTSRQTVTTILNELKEEGILVYSRKEILIKNSGALVS